MAASFHIFFAVTMLFAAVGLFMEAVRAKLKEAVAYIDRSPKLVRSITSFLYIVNSL